jgi:hypothetical protein
VSTATRCALVAAAALAVALAPAAHGTVRAAPMCPATHGRPASGPGVWARFVNGTTGAVSVYVHGVSRPDADDYVATLAPGEGRLQWTDLRHRFEFFDESGQCIGAVVPARRPEDYRVTGPGDISVAVTLTDNERRELGTVRFWAPVDARTPGARVATTLADPSLAAELVLRPGTCARPAAGRGYVITTEGPNPAAFTVDQLQRATWAVDLYDTEWTAHKRPGPVVACGEYAGLAPLATERTPIPASPVTARTEKPGSIVVRTKDGTVTLRSISGGKATRVFAEYSSAGGSTDMIGRVRPGTCSRLLPVADVPLRLPGNEVDDGEDQGGTIDLPVPLSSFDRRPYVFELGAGSWFYGDHANVCIPLSPR